MNNKYHEKAIKFLVKGFKEKIDEANCKETTEFVMNLLNKYIDNFSRDPDFENLISYQKKFLAESVGNVDGYAIISVALETFLINSISTFPFKKLFQNKEWYIK